MNDRWTLKKQIKSFRIESFLTCATGVIGSSLFLCADPLTLGFGSFVANLCIFRQLYRSFVVEQIDVDLGIVLLELLLVHQILLLTVVVSLLGIVFDQSHRVLMFEGDWLFGPVVVQSGGCHNAVKPELVLVGCCLDVAQNRLLYVWVLEELLLQLCLILWREVGTWVAPPIIRFSHNESTDQLAIIPSEIFGVFDIFHIRDDALRIEAVLLGSSELLIRKLLTLDSSRGELSDLAELSEIAWTWVVGLSGVVAGYLLLGVVWTLELLCLLLLSLLLLLVFREGKKKAFEGLERVQLRFQLILDEIVVKPKELRVVEPSLQQLLYVCLMPTEDFL